MHREPGDALLLDLIGELSGLLDLTELRIGMCHAFYEALPCRWSSLNELNSDGLIAALVHPHMDEVWIERFASLAHENPLYQRWQRTHDGRAYRFSDVISREDLEATDLYRTIYSKVGIEHQIAITLPAKEPDRILALVLHRDDRDFSDSERAFLNRARPFLIQAYRNAVAFTEHRRQSPAAVEAALVSQGLTGREAQVLRLVAHGGSNRSVGAALEVSERTVQKHLENAFRKLGVGTRSEAAARAWSLAAGP